MCYDMSLRYYEIMFMFMTMCQIFPCWALGSFLSVYVQEISFRGGKIRDAQRMCIDGEWSQGAERYSIRGCSLVYVFMVLDVFSAFSM